MVVRHHPEEMRGDPRDGRLLASDRFGQLAHALIADLACLPRADRVQVVAAVSRTLADRDSANPALRRRLTATAMTYFTHFAPANARLVGAELAVGRQRMDLVWARSKALLDGARIRTLRNAAGLTTRALARRLGTSPTTITNLETNTNHGDLPLRLVADLADALGAAPTELYARADAQPPVPGDDDQVIEAALLIARAATSASDLADALGWTLPRVRRAVSALAARQAQTGLRVHDSGWQRYALRPATEHLTDAQQRALHRLGPAQRGLNAQTAALLRQVAAHEVTETFWRSASASQQIALQRLLKQELIVDPPTGPFALSDDARYGLLSDAHVPATTT